MATIQIMGIEFPTAHEAVQWSDANGRGYAIRVWGRCLVVEKQEAERLEAAGVEFAFSSTTRRPIARCA